VMKVKMMHEPLGCALTKSWPATSRDNQATTLGGSWDILNSTISKRRFAG